MTLNPFIFGSASRLSCFDEKSPCLLEQTSMCVIDLAQKKDSGSTFPGQKIYVPWLVCMDTNGDKTAKCHAQVGIKASDVQDCLGGSRIKELIQQYLKADDPIHATPTVYVNGKEVKKTSFNKIKAAICKADPSLSGCSASAPNSFDPDREVPREHVIRNVVV